MSRVSPALISYRYSRAPVPGQAVRDAITRLPALDRQVAWLHVILRWAVPDIARFLDLEYSEVSASLSRARDAIRRHGASRVDEPGGGDRISEGA